MRKGIDSTFLHYGVRNEDMSLIEQACQDSDINTEWLKEQILKGDVHTIDEMKAWLKPLGYSDTINEAAINFILREFVMSKVSASSLMNSDMVVELLRPELEKSEISFKIIEILFLGFPWNETLFPHT